LSIYLSFQRCSKINYNVKSIISKTLQNGIMLKLLAMMIYDRDSKIMFMMSREDLYQEYHPPLLPEL